MVNIIYNSLKVFEKENSQICEKIRADERKKFAKWLEDEDYLWKVEYWYGEQCTEFITANTIIEEYEKELKNE